MTNTKQVKIKHSKILGIAWIIIALYDLFFGIQYLYQYSTPFVAWLYMIPMWITISKFFLAVFGSIIGVSIFRNRYHPQVVVFSLVLLLYILIDFLKIGSEMLVDSGSNIVFLGVSILTIKFTLDFELKHLLFWKDSKSLAFIALGLSPYFIHKWVSYDLFNFLH